MHAVWKTKILWFKVNRRIIFAGIWNTLFYLKFTNLSLEKGQYKGKQDYHSLFKEWNKKKTFSEKRRLQISATEWGLTTRYLLIQVIRWCDPVDPALSSTWRQVTLWSPQHFNKSRKTLDFILTNPLPCQINPKHYRKTSDSRSAFLPVLTGGEKL